MGNLSEITWRIFLESSHPLKTQKNLEKLWGAVVWKAFLGSSLVVVQLVFLSGKNVTGMVLEGKPPDRAKQRRTMADHVMAEHVRHP